MVQMNVSLVKLENSQSRGDGVFETLKETGKFVLYLKTQITSFGGDT